MNTRSSGALGWNYIERIVLHAGHKPHPVKQEFDDGIDGFIEYGNDDSARMVAVQVKRGKSYFDKHGPRVQTDKQHLKRWCGHQLPIMLVVVGEDEQAYWMNITAYIQHNPHVVDFGPYVLRPPTSQVFCERALNEEFAQLADKPPDFAQSVSLLCDAAPDVRRKATPGLIRYRNERRTVFCLAGVLRMEDDLSLLAHWCEGYSRYLGHPEAISPVNEGLRIYASTLIADMPEPQVLRLFASFSRDDETGDWSGATTIFDEVQDHEELWPREEIIDRGTLGQSIAVVLNHCTSAERLQHIFSNPRVPPQERSAATAVFAYLGHSCTIESLDEVMAHESKDEVLSALLYWLRCWLVAEKTGETATKWNSGLVVERVDVAPSFARVGQV